MTMGTAILEMVPISLSTGHGSDMPAYYPMARAIAGGLAFFTLVSLLFLSTIYAILDDLRPGTTRLMRRARGKPAAPTAAAAGLRVQSPVGVDADGELQTGIVPTAGPRTCRPRTRLSHQTHPLPRYSPTSPTH